MTFLVMIHSVQSNSLPELEFLWYVFIDMIKKDFSKPDWQSSGEHFIMFAQLTLMASPPSMTKCLHTKIFHPKVVPYNSARTT